MNLFRIFILIGSVALTACSNVPNKNPADPFESFNRGMYSFNDKVDKGIAKPLAKGYSAVMPETAQIMVSNFFSNLDDVLVTMNDLLQFKLTQGISDGMRVLVNTTIGIGGLIDVASDRLPKHNEDFGQTLGYWGFGDGPYLVLPFLGSSTLRDALGIYPDSLVSPISNTQHIRTRNQLVLTKTINRRAQLLVNERLVDEAALDRYQFLRDSYLANRKNLVYDGNPPREKYEEFDDEEIEPVSGVVVVPVMAK